jgi:CRP/FNR family transcriptional regulator, cyclic AMP receptor protein
MAESNFIEQSKLHFKEGEAIFRKGEMAQQMYIVLNGKVRLYVGQEAKGDWIEEFAKGDFFGEGSLLEAMPRAHTAIALEDSDVIAITRGTFMRMIRQNPEVSVKMLQRLAQRNREMNERIENGEVKTSSAQTKSRSTDPVARLVSVLSGRAYPILAHGSLIGRFDPNTGVHPDIDLTEEDHNLSVSRRHARILCEHGRYFLLEEPGVANGTFIKGERIASGDARELKAGDRVGFGMVVLFFEKA